MKFTWAITKLTVAEDNLVVKVDWRVTATDNDLTASAVGSRTLVRGDNSVPYKELTEQQVLDWCFEPEIVTFKDQTTVTKRLKDEGEAQVANQIARKLAEKESEPALPWAKSIQL